MRERKGLDLGGASITSSVQTGSAMQGDVVEVVLFMAGGAKCKKLKLSDRIFDFMQHEKIVTYLNPQTPGLAKLLPKVPPSNTAILLCAI